ncbi:endospore germination permease [Cohnella sp. GCM10027633]|uniref:GerAB/ArcD/ProY family transporter n=1 Tax=unclassified Cohnella TaxID=2636738 RepID=UPI0036378DE4
MSQRRLSSLQLFFLFVLTLTIANHTLTIPLVLGAAKRDAWMSVLLSVVPGVLLLLAVKHIMNTSRREPLLPWVKRHFGPFASGAVGVVLVAYLLSNTMISVKDTVTWVDATFLPDTPGFVIGAALSVLCFIAAYAGLWSIAVCAGMLLPFVVVLEEFVVFANFPLKNYRHMTPLLEHGMSPVWSGLVYTASGIAEIVLVLLVQHRLKANVRSRAIYWALAVVVFFILQEMIESIVNFGPSEAAAQRYPSFEQWGLVTLGKSVSHLDFLSIYEWLSGSFVRISLGVYLAIELTRTKGKAARKLVLGAMFSFMIAVPLLPVNDSMFERFLRRMYYPYSLALMVAVVLVLLAFSAIVRAKERGRASHAQ